ncbi:unnamed protein product [Effrenium voratum]|nr:unnamed protein product [Effrenium voratum]
MRRGRNVGGSVVGASLELRHKGSPIIASATPSKVHSTPSRIISIRTPLRPCSRQRSKEVQDDVRSALEEQSAELLRVALQRRHVCPRDHALHEAVRQGNCAAARLLLQNSAEPNDRCLSFERGCEFPLQLALSSNLVRPSERLEMVDMLLQARADVSQRRSDPEGCPPLHDAIRRGDAAIVQLLLRYQADPNATNAFGEAPLELAVRGSPFVAVSDSASLMEAGGYAIARIATELVCLVRALYPVAASVSALGGPLVARALAAEEAPETAGAIWAVNDLKDDGALDYHSVRTSVSGYRGWHWRCPRERADGARALASDLWRPGVRLLALQGSLGVPCGHWPGDSWLG